MTSEEPSLDTEDVALAEIVHRLVSVFHPERIRLFGSKARGDAGPDSDYDIMVIVSDSARPEQRRSGLAYEALWGSGLATDVLVWSGHEFDSRLHLRASLPSTVLSEGKLLYATSDCRHPIWKAPQDVEWVIALPVCVPLAACPPVQRQNTGSLLPVAPRNPDLGVFLI